MGKQLQWTQEGEELATGSRTQGSEVYVHAWEEIRWIWGGCCQWTRLVQHVETTAGEMRWQIIKGGEQKLVWVDDVLWNCMFLVCKSSRGWDNWTFHFSPSWIDLLGDEWESELPSTPPVTYKQHIFGLGIKPIQVRWEAKKRTF